ncbi:glycosyltransferase [Candidatus Woesearchaeota archaeon]|nr:glycosyltransferase [Candidatus Woesearchaeota archaeon]
MLSIIIPAYNEEHYLPALLSSIKKQNLKNIEIIVADNSSRDRTRQIARKFGCRVVKGGKRPGIGRNNGAKIAKGSLLLFLDADCCLKPGFIRGILKEFRKKDLGVAGCFLRPMSDRLVDRAYFSIFNTFTKLSEKTSPSLGGCCILVKRDIHRKIGGFDEDIRLLEEHDYVKRCRRYGRFRIISRKIDTSVRRFDEFGRIKVGSALVLSAAYKTLFGPIKKDIFHYSFNYKK